MLLIHPPLTKPSEPPAGLACLAGLLKERRIKHAVVDLNLEGLCYLLREPFTAGVPQKEGSSLRTKLAIKNRAYYLEGLRQPALYRKPDAYKKAVFALSHLCSLRGLEQGFILSLANYEHRQLSPLRSRDLLAMAARPELDPFYPFFLRRLPELIEETQPRVVGFSLNFLHQALCTFAMLGFIKKSYPSLKLVLGGGLVTSWLSNSRWQNPFRGLVDELVAGPGEDYLLSYYGLEAGQAGQSRPLASKPDFDPFRQLAYFAPGFILPVSGSRGCYWKKCAFCPERAEDNPYRTLSPRQFTQHLQELIRAYDPVLIHFLDNALSLSQLRALIAEPPNRPWYGYTRFLPELTSFDFCLALKQSGCRLLKLGLESADSEVLAGMQKGIELENVPVVLANLKKAGIAVYLYILFGTPWETREKAEKTRDFIAKHSEEITFLNAALFSLPLDSPEAARLQGREFYAGDLSLYAEYSHPQGWNRREIRLFMRHELRQHKAIAPLLNRIPPFFTSNHAAFF